MVAGTEFGGEPWLAELRPCFAPGTLPQELELMVDPAESTQSILRLLRQRCVSEWTCLAGGSDGRKVHDVLRRVLSEDAPVSCDVLSTRADRTAWEDAFRARVLALGKDDEYAHALAFKGK